MNKTYGRINWENYPSDETPVNERNLNKMDRSIDIIDDRVITLDTTKATKAEVATLVADVTFEESTGIITVTKKNGSVITIDTQLEKIAVNFSYNAETQQIILTLIDGTKQYIDLAALITQYEFLDSDTVAFSIDSAGKVSAIVKEASIQEKHLRPNYLADIKVEVAKAQASQSAAAKSESNAKASETAAAASESNAAASATKAQSYATGGTNSRTGEDTDNAKYYSQQSAQSQSAAAESADTASAKAEEAAASAATAKTNADNAAGSANIANEKANSATNSATIAVSNSNAAQQYASNAAISADTAQNYAVADTDSAKYYYEQARRISESFSGALRPMGTVTFANLPALSETASGSMYNISDQFTTTNDFKEGEGNTIPAGANVYKTEDGKWDVLAGTPVTGVKGSAESAYRRGNVNITADNVGALSLKNGGNVTGDTSFQGKRRVHYVDDGTGRAGYDKIARFTANSAYNNAAIEIELARRTDTVPTCVAIMFAGNACYAVTCMGHTKDVFMCKESDGVWVLYVKKTHEWCTTSVLDYVHSSFADGVTVEWIVSSSANYAESLPNTEIISGSWGYIVKEAMEADGTATVLDYNDTSKKIKVGWVGSALNEDQILSVACYASGDNDIVKAKIKDVSKATFKNWLGEVSPSDGSGYYVKNENLSDIDLNNVTTTGIYHLTGTLTNNPINGNATLFVEFEVGTPYQIFIPDYAYITYKRTYSNSSWGGWVCLNDYIPINGTSNLSGDIVPNTDVKLGSANHWFEKMYSSEVRTDGILLQEDGQIGIFASGNDSAGGPGESLNNLVIKSWWGVSFTSGCGGTQYGGKDETAVGIDCRTGDIKAHSFNGLVNGHGVNADVPSDAKFTDTKGTCLSGRSLAYGWSVNHLASGYLIEAFHTAAQNYTMTNQYGNMYWASFEITIPQSNNIKFFDAINITPFATSGLISVSITNYTTSKIQGFVFSPLAETKSISFHVTLHGTAS